MKRKIGLMFTVILTMAIVWVGTTGSSWASPASGTVPPGTGPYRVTATLKTQQAVYSLYKPTGIKPVGLAYLLRGASTWAYTKSTGKPAVGTMKVCGIIKASQVGQVYRLTKGKWVALASTISKGTPKMVCTKKAVSAGKYVVIGH